MGETLVVNFKVGAVDRNLMDHLNANRTHYGQAIFRSLDAVQIGQLLSGYGYQLGDKLVPVMQMVEPRPILSAMLGTIWLSRPTSVPLPDPTLLLTQPGTHSSKTARLRSKSRATSFHLDLVVYLQKPSSDDPIVQKYWMLPVSGIGR